MSNEPETKRLPDGVTEEQLTQLIRKHGRVHSVPVCKDGKRYVGLFRKPTLADMSAAASVGTSDPMAGADLMYNSCKLAVDPEMDSDEEVRLAAMKGVQALFRVLEAEVGEVFGAGA